MEAEIAELFEVLAKAREDHFFLPHPLTPEHASVVAGYQGHDFYAIALFKGKAIAYGLLRGWDEGYEIPSLGLSVHPQYRHGGIGLALMHYLHAVAVLRGSEKTRLRVNKENYRAKGLYEKSGYRFEEDNEEYFVGLLELKQPRGGQVASSAERDD